MQSPAPHSDAHQVLELQPLCQNGVERSEQSHDPPAFAGASPESGMRLLYADEKPEQANNLLLLHQDNMLPTAVRIRTMLVLNLAFIMERADEAVLGGAGVARRCLICLQTCHVSGDLCSCLAVQVPPDDMSPSRCCSPHPGMGKGTSLGKYSLGLLRFCQTAPWCRPV